MKRRIIIFLLIIACFLIQTTVWTVFRLGNVKPNLMILFTVSMGLMRGKKNGMWVGFLSGLLVDLFYGPVFGFNAMIYLYAGFFSGSFYKVFFNDDLRISMIMTAAGDFFVNFVYYCMLFVTHQRFNFFEYLVHIIIPEVVYTVLCAVLLYKLFYYINKRLVADEIEDKDSPWLIK